MQAVLNMWPLISFPLLIVANVVRLRRYGKWEAKPHPEHGAAGTLFCIPKRQAYGLIEA